MSPNIILGTCAAVIAIICALYAILTEKAQHGRSSKPHLQRQVYCLCGELSLRDDKYDCYYCPVSNQWLEDKCDDTTCRFCPNRPAKHIEPMLP